MLRIKILLVEPDFPIAAKSKNHSHFLPIGLLKIGSYHRVLGDAVRLLRGISNSDIGFIPNKILITSLFTYWSEFVAEAAHHYHGLFPRAKVEIGGVYASLLPEHCKAMNPFAKISKGLYRNGVAENVPIDFSLLPDEIDYQIIHTSRGCKRQCTFCGTWKIEPEFTYKETILPEIKKPKLVFYDNNLLANPCIDKILKEITAFRLNGRPISCESQSGFDLRLLTPEKAQLLKDANFKNPRIAWDSRYSSWPRVRKAIKMLQDVGYSTENIFVFMIYNFELSSAEMRQKLDACRRWGVRVIDCRYRPLDSTDDGYKSSVKCQSTDEYYIHPNWTDKQVRGFRRGVRRQNIAILLNLPHNRYIPGCERGYVNVQ